MKKQDINDEDKLLCKKNLLVGANKYLYVDNYYIVMVVYGPYEYCYYFNDENDRILPFSFSIKEMSEHFYTKQEERKIKLEKIY